ncbi:MAG: pitrilysin family protein [Patescibacteria group bacterium]
MKYSKKVLSNGLTVIEVPSHDAESVVVDFFVKTGSRSETPKENGISHFLEHFLFKGTKKYPSALAISTLIDSIGGEMNANTGKEHTQFYIKAASQHLELIFEVLTDMVQNPLLDLVELEKEKGVIVEEINMYKDTPMCEIENILEKTMWPKDALGREIAGTKNTVTKFNRKMFLDYINRHYQTSNMILGVSGKYDSRVLDSLIKEHWQKKRMTLKEEGHPLWERVKDRQISPRLKVQYKQTEQAHLVLGFKGFAYGDKRNSAQSVLSAILGGGMSSRLFMEVRERRGLAYYVRASGGNYQDTGIFNIGAGVQIGKIEEALKVIMDELEKIKNQKVDGKELTKVKEYLKGKAILALEDNQVRLDWFLEAAAFRPKIEKPEEVFKRIDAVSSGDIKKVAEELFKKKQMTLAIIGPYKHEQVFKKLLSV